MISTNSASLVRRRDKRERESIRGIIPDECKKERARSKLPPNQSIAQSAIVTTSASLTSHLWSSRCCMALSKSSTKQYIAMVRSYIEVLSLSLLCRNKILREDFLLFKELSSHN